MVLGENAIQETHYDTLSVKEDASHEEIRIGYRHAILNFHPDKLERIRETSNLDHDSGERFLKVQKAWEILGNSKSRSAYDFELRASRYDAELADDVSFEEMSVEDDGEVLRLFLQCRCGEYFCIDSVELGEMGCVILRGGSGVSLKTPDDLPASVVVPCGSCSLKARFLINTDTRLSTHADT